MNKEEFLKFFFEEDMDNLSNLYGKISKSINSNIDIYTDEFYTPNIWSKLIDMESSMETKISAFGIFEDAERRILKIGDNFPSDVPLVLAKISSKSKFTTLYHKDYLGAIMSLGINREKFGDVVLIDGGCYFATTRRIYDYVALNLDRVANSPISISFEDYSENLSITVPYEEMSIIVTSRRLDSMVSSIIKTSRNKALEVINKKEVLVNYKVSQDKSLAIKENDLLTIRGFGKYRICNTFSYTAKDRLKILIKKYK